MHPFRRESGSIHGYLWGSPACKVPASGEADVAGRVFGRRLFLMVRSSGRAGMIMRMSVMAPQLMQRNPSQVEAP
jgi:hypothetical protein